MLGIRRGMGGAEMATTTDSASSDQYYILIGYRISLCKWSWVSIIIFSLKNCLLCRALHGMGIPYGNVTGMDGKGANFWEIHGLQRIWDRLHHLVPLKTVKYAETGGNGSPIKYESGLERILVWLNGLERVWG